MDDANLPLTDSDKLAARIEQHEDDLLRRAMKLDEADDEEHRAYRGPLCECGKRGAHKPNWHCGYPR